MMGYQAVNEPTEFDGKLPAIEMVELMVVHQ